MVPSSFMISQITADGLSPALRDIDRGLGVASAHQGATLARDEGEHMAWGDDLLAPTFGIDRDRNGVGAVVRGDAGRDPLGRLDRDGEGGLVAGAVVPAHEGEAKLLDALAGQGEADQAAGVAGHEVDRVGGGELRGDHQVAFVFAILVIDQDEHAAVAGLLDQLVDAGEVLRQRGGLQFGHQRNSASRAT
jgi:hypothetical protein